MATPAQPRVDTVEPVDLLIITAADAEDDAVREVREAALGEWRETPGPPGYGFAVWRNEYRAAAGGRISVALTRAVQMGGEGAGNAAARLVDAYKPRCLAMCGVCAGNPGRVQLGDVVVAELVWRYDEGALVNTAPGGRPVLHPRITTYQLNAQWKQAAEYFLIPPETEWLQSRPRSRELQENWVLHELYNGRNPLESPERERFCHDWTDVVRALQKENLISVKNGEPELTKRGRDRITTYLFNHGGKLPEPETWKIAVGPLGTGNNLVKDVDIWDRLQSTQQRYVLGLEMEGSVIGFTAHVHNVQHVIVVKGVMDHAEPGRTQGFRLFAARAAAEVLLGFVRTRLEPHAADILKPNVAEPPKEATNPGTLLNARYQVVPFFDETRQRELDELRAWCDSQEPTSVRLFYGPGGAGKTRLLIEWCRRLRERGWKAGFLAERVAAEDLAALLATETPTLAVVDYAESRPDLLALLRGVAQRTPNSRTRFRLALLAREVGDWWRVLHEQDAEWPTLWAAASRSDCRR